MKKNKKQKINRYKKLAGKTGWDDLAHEIIKIENRIAKEKDRKSLFLLKLKLDIWEQEKKNRVFDSFDMKYFLAKEFEPIEEDFFTKTDI